MALPVIPGVVRLACRGLMSNGAPWANVTHWRFTGGASSPGTSDIAALQALAVRFWQGAVFGSGQPALHYCHTVLQFNMMSFLILDGSSLGVDYPLSLLGTGTGSSLPCETSAVLTMRTAQRGRSHRGRIYLPTFTAGNIDTNGRIVNATAVAIVAQMQGLATALGGPSVSPFWEAGVASYKLGTFSPLLLPTMDLDMDVQRRRKH